MSRLRDAWRRWAAQLATREPATSLALFRVGVGVSLLVSMGLALRADVIGLIWVDARFGGMVTLNQNWLVQLLGGATPAVARGLVWMTVVAGALVTVGLGGRLPKLIAGQTLLALTSLLSVASGGFDPLTMSALWLLFLADSNRTLSLDCRLRTGRWTSQRPVPAWPRYLAVLQLVVLYGATGLHKLGATWLPTGGYSALYWALQDAVFRRLETAWVAWVYPLTQLGTFVAWSFEVLSPLLLLVFYCRATRARPGRLRALVNRWDLRAPYTLVGLCLHLGILALFEVGPFSYISLSFYFCLWRPEELARAWARLTGRARRRDENNMSS